MHGTFLPTENIFSAGLVGMFILCERVGWVSWRKKGVHDVWEWVDGLYMVMLWYVLVGGW